MPDPTPINWEAFYQNYRKPGYVSGFEILHKIGSGSFGIVFKARKESIAKDYAIKVLKVDDEAVRDAIISEINSVRLFAQIDHPNLVSIEDKGEVDGVPYIVMNYAGDATLRGRLDDGNLTREDALRIFIQVARGVQALHEHSLVHFDLKPANVFLKGDLARVGDYGLSKLVSQSRNSLSFGRGTPFYMAPEVLQRRGDHRSDIYSLGVMLFEVLTGKVPFGGDSEWEVLRKHETSTVEFPPEVGATERAVISRCLAKRPGDRFASVQEMLSALQCTPDQHRTPAASVASTGEPARFATPPAPPRNVENHGDESVEFVPSQRRKFGMQFLVLLALMLGTLAVGIFATRSMNKARGFADAGSTAQIPPPREMSIRASSTTTTDASTFDPSALAAFAYPADTSRKTIDYIGAYIKKLPGLCEDDDSERARIARKLARYKPQVMVYAVNELRSLNLRHQDDLRKAYELDHLLTRVTGMKSEFRITSSKRSPRTSEVERNTQAIKSWWSYLRDTGKAELSSDRN